MSEHSLDKNVRGLDRADGNRRGVDPTRNWGIAPILSRRVVPMMIVWRSHTTPPTPLTPLAPLALLALLALLAPLTP